MQTMNYEQVNTKLKERFDKLGAALESMEKTQDTFDEQIDWLNEFITKVGKALQDYSKALKSGDEKKIEQATKAVDDLQKEANDKLQGPVNAMDEMMDGITSVVNKLSAVLAVPDSGGDDWMDDEDEDEFGDGEDFQDEDDWELKGEPGEDDQQ